MKKKYVIASISLVSILLISAMSVIQANTGNPFEEFLRRNGWSYVEFRRMVNRGDYNEEIGSKLESTSYVSYMRVESLEELFEGSELVVRGVVKSSIIDATFDPEGIDMPDVYTNFTIRIQDVLKGDYSEKTIVVAQMGGVYRGTVFRVKDDPLMNVGDEVVLYLVMNPSISSYVIKGGPQGRFLVVDSELYNIAEIDPSIQIVSENLKTKGADVAHLRELLIP